MADNAGSPNRNIRGDVMDDTEMGMEFEQNAHEPSSSKVESAEKRDSVMSLNHNYKTYDKT